MITLTPAPAYAVIKTVVSLYPEIIPMLEGRARWIAVASMAGGGGDEIKTEEQYLSRLTSLVERLYAGEIGGEFIDDMAALLSRQIELAHINAWRDEGDGETEKQLPEYLQANADEMILSEFDYVDQYYRDIVDARIDGTPIEPLLVRANLWAHRYVDAYENAVHLITLENGGKEEWKLGQTEKHCWICSGLNGIILFAREWEELDIHPQGGPNPVLSLETADGDKGCGGWLCDCARQPTDKRRTPKGYEQVLNLLSQAEGR